MSRKLFIVDRPPGPMGGARYEFRMFAASGSALRNSAEQRINGAISRDKGTVLVVDLDELPKLDATHAEAYEHAERWLMHYTAEEARLRPALRSNVAAPRDSTREAKIDLVLDAARDWRRQYEKRCEQVPSYKPTRREVLLFHALVTLDDGPPCMCGRAEHPSGCEEWCDGGK